MTMKTKLILTALLLVTALAYGAIGAFSAETPKPYVADPTAREVTIDMKAYKYAFDPGDITVYEGQKITLNITAVDRKHGFKLDGYDVNVTLPQGEITTVTFVADKTGDFSFKCSVFCGTGHMKMKGVLKVVKP
jgi:heme/copper-type cytochrome/quinol oxidase subunit 2